MGSLTDWSEMVWLGVIKVCGSLNKLGPWRVALLGGVVLLEEVWSFHCEGRAWRSHVYAYAWPV